MKEFLVYTAARLALFLASYVIVVGIYLLVSGEDTIPVLWPFLVAVVISAIGSIYLLRGQRERFALAVQQRAERAAARRRAVEAEQGRMDAQAAGQADEGTHTGTDERPEDERPEDEQKG